MASAYVFPVFGDQGRGRRQEPHCDVRVKRTLLTLEESLPPGALTLSDRHQHQTKRIIMLAVATISKSSGSPSRQ
jgi:hypothetical protein